MAFHGSAGSGVGRAYIEFVANHDRGIIVPSESISDVSAASYMLGRYCCQLTDHDERAARMTHNNATRILRQHSDGATARLALLSAKLIDYRSQDPLSKARDALLKETRQQMASARDRTGRMGDKYSEMRQRAYGQLAEQATLLAISYNTDNRFLIQQALPHHDQRHHGRASANFDLTATVASTHASFTQQLQVKLQCLGWCSDPRPEAKTHQLEARSVYNDDIKLVSGCCDLGMRPLDNDRYDLTLVRNLMSDDPERSQRVVRIAYGLLHIIEDGADRRGFLSVAEEAPLAA